MARRLGSMLLLLLAAAAPASAAPVDGFPDLGRLTGAKRITIVDRWSGLGHSYGFVATLQRDGTGHYVGLGALTTRRGQSARLLRVSEAAVRALLAEVQGRGPEKPTPPPTGQEVTVVWTDDYPEGQVLIEDRPDAAPVRLFFTDQKRIWRVSRGERSFRLATRPGERIDRRESPQPRLHGAYQALLKQLGLDAWIKQAYGRSGRR